jgi:hypothetical protein
MAYIDDTIRYPFKRPLSDKFTLTFQLPASKKASIEHEVLSLDDSNPNKPILSDFIIKVQHRSFYTHKLILYLETDYFRKLFQTSDFKSNEFDVTTLIPQANWSIKDIELLLNMITPPYFTSDSVSSKHEREPVIEITTLNIDNCFRLHQYFNIPKIEDLIDKYLLDFVTSTWQIQKQLLNIIVPILVQGSATNMINYFVNHYIKQ